MRVQTATLKDFASTMWKMAKSDRYNLMGVGGFMGSGKSCFLTKLATEYSKLSQTPYSYNNNITWLREELVKWIDGEGEDKKEQKNEYSAIIADEFISMFYKRNWYKDGQKEVVELFNKIRDRHLFVGGAIPNFWDLDGGLLSNITYYVYITQRGVAWVFEQENNPFTKDPWNVDENRKIFRKNRNPYKCPNFLIEIRFNDWTPEQKEEYYKIRNKKRKNTEGQNEKKENNKNTRGVQHRNMLIRHIVHKRLMGKKELKKMLGYSDTYFNEVVRGDK